MHKLQRHIECWIVDNTSLPNNNCKEALSARCCQLQEA